MRWYLEVWSAVLGGVTAKCCLTRGLVWTEYWVKCGLCLPALDSFVCGGIVWIVCGGIVWIVDCSPRQCSDDLKVLVMCVDAVNS